MELMIANWVSNFVGWKLKDAELCTIMEEEEPNVMVHDEDPAPVCAAPSSSEERALVVYDPTNTPLVKSPSSPDFSIVVKADLIPGLKGMQCSCLCLCLL